MAILASLSCVCACGVAGCDNLPGLAAHGGSETRTEAARDPAARASRPESIAQAPETSAPRLAIRLSDHPVVDPTAEYVTPFSIATTHDLYIYSIWSALDGAHTELQQFYAPSGDLYYQKLIPFSTEIDEASPFTQSVSVPHATFVRPVTPDERGNVIVRDYFAVAGTSIGEHQLTGTWHVEISLDGARTPTLSHSFELVP